MPKYVLDASALLALINQEKGAEVVSPLLHECIMSCVNVCECASVLRDLKIPSENIQTLLDELIAKVIPFDAAQAYETAFLREKTKLKGLSLGDRACLSLGRLKKLPVVTADRVWAEIDCGVKVILIR
jgi:PIN domain nuclease of toxin-antitoxin system